MLFANIKNHSFMSRDLLFWIFKWTFWLNRNLQIMNGISSQENSIEIEKFHWYFSKWFRCSNLFLNLHYIFFWIEIKIIFLSREKKSEVLIIVSIKYGKFRNSEKVWLKLKRSIEKTFHTVRKPGWKCPRNIFQWTKMKKTHFARLVNDAHALFCTNAVS